MFAIFRLLFHGLGVVQVINTLYGTCYMLLRRLAKAIISCTPFPVTAPLECQYTSNLLAEVCFGSKPPLSNVSNNDL